MPLIVQKFGGSSLADPDRILSCAVRVAEARQAGHDVLVVVSAMGDTTDELISMADAVNPAPSRRELDALLASGEQISTALMTMALHRSGVDAVSLTGGQLGISTDSSHSKARIRRIDARRIRRELRAGRVVVGAGFQGVSEDGDITTLGRGGSDTTAVALAAALKVGQKGGACEIYTDVDGVYTADPRVVSNARLLKEISSEEMLELAALGASVIHARAVLFGERFNVPIHVRHSAKPESGTMIMKDSSNIELNSVVGCAIKHDLGRVTLRRIPNIVGVQSTIFGLIAKRGILVDDIVQTEFSEMANISFTVDHSELQEAKIVASEVLEELGSGEISIEVGLAKVSVIGAGMRSHSGVASTMFQALAAANIPIHNITTSEIRISCIVPKESGKLALGCLHDAFKLSDGGSSMHVPSPASEDSIA
ncbi:MAG: aspartate kinase [Phycisphaerae bacterium]|nr:aspartate kinase [Phycisphaerae bacterium]